MLIVHEDHAMSVLSSGDAAGSYGYQRLKRSMTAFSENPSEDDRKLVNVIITNLRPSQTAVASSLLGYAAIWKDAALWTRLVEWLKYELHRDLIEEGWKAFGFEAVRVV